MSVPGGIRRAAAVRGVAGVAAATIFLVATLAGDEPRPSADPLAPATLFGVGDILHCDSPQHADLTGQLMQRLLDVTPNSRGVTFGDNSNDDGSEESYSCLDRSAWGGLMPVLYPTPGNHDYMRDKVLPFYFLYFPKAGQPGLGYYAYDFGGWRVYALNSELMSADPNMKQGRDAQLAWLEHDLRVYARSRCTVAYFHRPPFSSGRFASPAWVMPIFRKLYKHGVDVVATGHEHFFAALPPLNPDGALDTSHGIPILIAGTGGAVFFDRPRTLKYGKDGEVIVTRTLGVLRLTLKARGFDWAFVPVDPAGARPSGTGLCHENPPLYAE